MEKRSWKEFRESGLLWWVNMILHTFGWSIVVAFDDEGEVIESYPARVEFRGFEEHRNDEGYKKVTKYINEHSDKLLSEVNQDKNEN